MANHTVSAIAVIDLTNELIERGYLREDEFADLGRGFNHVHTAWTRGESIQELRLPESLLIALWHKVETRDCSEYVGVEIGSRVNQQAKGVLANWLFQCQTLGEAFATFSENIALLNPSEHWQKQVVGEQVRLTFQFTSPAYPEQAIDRSMAAMLSWSRALSEEEICPLAVTFTRQAPRDADKYVQIFGENTSFGKPENSILFKRSIFDQAIKDANPYLKSLVAKQAQTIQGQLSSHDLVSGKVAALLREDLMTFCQIGATCEALHVSRSTLYRKLKMERTSFTQLVREARLRKLAKREQYAAGQYDLAQELGFEDISSYYRFRKQNHQ